MRSDFLSNMEHFSVQTYHSVCDCRGVIPGLCCVHSMATAWPWQGLSPRAWLRTWASSGTPHPREVYMRNMLLSLFLIRITMFKSFKSTSTIFSKYFVFSHVHSFIEDLQSLIMFKAFAFFFLLQRPFSSTRSWFCYSSVLAF